MLQTKHTKEKDYKYINFTTKVQVYKVCTGLNCFVCKLFHRMAQVDNYERVTQKDKTLSLRR